MQQQKIDQEVDDVIVVGGGLSGLTAANEILKATPTAKVRVLEAMSEVGGRTQNIKINNCTFELGGQFIGPTQKHAIELAKECNNELETVDVVGRKILDLNGAVSTYTSNIPSDVNIIALLQMNFVLWKIDRMAQTVPLDNPRNCPMGHQWDSMTLQSWINQNVWFEKIKLMLEASIRVVLGTQLCEVSFLHFLWFVHQNKGFQTIINAENGLQQKKTKEGAQKMSFYLQEQIKKKGGEVHTKQYVLSIDQSQGVCIVKTKEGCKYVGKYIIMAMPPTHVGRVQFIPKLSEQRRLLCGRNAMGVLTKVILLYDKRYWSEKGFSGEIVSDCLDAPAMIGYDDTRTNDHGTLQPALIVFVGGALYSEWKLRQDFIPKLTAKLADYFGEQAMRYPLAVEWKKWDDVDSVGGGPVSNYPPGVLSKVGSLRRPEGRVHWAGTETADESSGYMDGAIQSGKRVAKQILARVAGKILPKEPPLQQSAPNYTQWLRGPKKWIQWW